MDQNNASPKKMNVGLKQLPEKLKISLLLNLILQIGMML